MRCLNEDEKEQYKGDKNIITAVLVSDTVPEEFPHNGKPITNLTENDILAPGSRMMILDGSDDIYVMKESNFNPDAVIGTYEIVIQYGPGNQGAVNVKLVDEKGTVIDSTSIAYCAEGGYEHAYPYTFHGIIFNQDGWQNNELMCTIDENCTDAIYVDGVRREPGDQIINISRDTLSSWRNAGLLPKKLDNIITAKNSASTEWLKIGG